VLVGGQTFHSRFRHHPCQDVFGHVGFQQTVPILW
jgi:hypothetical protein